MTRYEYSGFLCLCLILAALSLLPCLAIASAQPRQDVTVVRDAALAFLQTQVAGLPGKAEITLGPVDTRLNLSACAALEPSFPPGSRAWGNTTVVLRCAAPHSWTVYVRAMVKVTADYVISAKPLIQGRVLLPDDVTMRSGDLSQLPPGVITHPDRAYGKTLTVSLPAGSPLRQDVLRAQAAVMQNQAVKLVSSGRGFSISAEGRALNNAEDGQVVQVRSPSGSVVSGIARAGAIVEVSY